MCLRHGSRGRCHHRSLPAGAASVGRPAFQLSIGLLHRSQRILSDRNGLYDRSKVVMGKVNVGFSRGNMESSQRDLHLSRISSIPSPDMVARVAAGWCRANRVSLPFKGGRMVQSFANSDTKLLRRSGIAHWTLAHKRWTQLADQPAKEPGFDNVVGVIGGLPSPI